MATIQTCALSSRITSYEFGELESRAVELAGGKDPTNKHYIAAAQDLIATRQSWIEQINKALGKKEKADAVQEQGAAEVPAREGAGGGSTVGEEVPGQGQPAGEGQAGGEAPAAGEVAKEPKKAAPRAAQVNRDLTANVDLTPEELTALIKETRRTLIAGAKRAEVDPSADLEMSDAFLAQENLYDAYMTLLIAAENLFGAARAAGDAFVDRVSTAFQKLSDEHRRVLTREFGDDMGAIARAADNFLNRANVRETVARGVDRIDDLVQKADEALGRAVDKLSDAVKRALRALTNALLSVALVFSTVQFDAYARPMNVPLPKTESVVIKHVENPRANFGPLSAGADARFVADWVVGTKNNVGKPFTIVDKRNAQAYVFSADGSILGAAPVLVGAARGDVVSEATLNKPLEATLPEEKITPAGRTEARVAPSSSYGTSLQFRRGAGSVYAMHRMYTGTAKERRAERMASRTPEDNRVTYGCVNVGNAFYDDLIVPTFEKTGGVMYVLPDTQSIADTFPGVAGYKQAETVVTKIATTPQSIEQNSERNPAIIAREQAATEQQAPETAPVFRDTDPQTPPKKPITREKLQSIVDKINRAIGGRVEVVISNSVTDVLPEQKAGTRSGALIKNQVHLFIDGIADGIEGQKTIFHEFLHKGVRNLLTTPERLAMFRRLYDETPSMRRAADSWLAENAGDVKNKSRDEAIALAVEERIAEFTEGTTIPAMLLRRLADFFARLARKMGLTDLARWIDTTSKNNLEAFVYDALRAAHWAKTADERAAEAAAQETMFRPGTPAFDRWFGKSKVVDAEGKPKIMYHGTARDISAFKAKQAGAIFLTESPYFANAFTSMSEYWMLNNYQDILTEEQQEAARRAVPRLLKQEGITGREAESVMRQIKGKAPSGVAQDIWFAALKEQMPTGPNIMPLYVRAERPFDYQNRSSVESVVRRVQAETQTPSGERRLPPDYFDRMLTGDWGMIEHPAVQRAIRALGFDSFYVREGGQKNLAVYEPTQIKSAIGNRGTYDPTNPDITYRPGDPAFDRWFGDSKVVDAEGKPLVMYHGTSKDADFSRFKVPGNGAWFTSDSSGASTYAMENESMGPKYDRDSRTYKDTNTASRVIPVYLRIKRPYTPTAEDNDVLRRATNYRRAQRVLFDRLRREGYDGVDMGDGVWVVIKEPTQIKSAIGNRGTYDPTNPDITYRTARGSAEAMRDVLKVDGMVKARRAVLSASFLRDIRARFGSGKNEIAGVEDFAKATFDMSAAAAEIQEEGTKVFDALNSLSTKEKTDVTELMADATSSMVYAEGDNSHLGEQARIEAGKLQARFKAFNDKQKRAYRLARDALKANWEKRGRLLAAKVNEVYTPLINAARAAGDDRKVRTLERQRADFLREQNEALSSIRGDYFPLMRFGEYVVVRKSTGYNELSDKVDEAYKYLDKLLDEYETRTPEERKAIARANKKLKGTPSEFDAEFTEEQAEELKAARQVYQDLRKKLEAMKSDPNQYYMAQFDTLAEAEADAARVKGTALLKRERTRELSPVSRAMLEQVNESITAEMRATGNVAALREARQALYQVFLTSMPERSALLRQAKRKYVAGFSRDMERSVISSILTDSFYLSRMEHADRITEALNRVWSDSETKGVPAQEVARELQRRLILSMRYTDTPIQDAITGVTYAWLLGVSPGYLIANLTQPFLVSLPKLWSRHGMRSNAVFGKALGDASRMVSKHAGSLLRGELRLEDSGLPANEAALLQDMLRERLLSVTLVSDLARTADGKAVSRFTSLVARPGHVVEMVNRISTALAAYRLERGKGRSDADAKAYAVEVLADTHFDYSAENAPYWMKPGALPGNKLFFQFKKYQLGMISLLTKTLVTAAKGDKVPKAEARRMIFGVLATHMAVGGMIGLPAFGTMAFLANMVAAAFGDDEEPWDARVALRNYLYDSFGPEIGNVLAKGLPTILGADMSQKTGLGDVLNPLPTVREDKEGRDFYLELLAAGMGPFFGGIAPRAFDAANQLAAGNFVKGAEGLLPKWMADPIKAGRFAEEGVTTRKGTVALPRDQLDAADIFLQSIGIPAQQITDAYEARAAVEGVKATLNERIGRLKNRWVDAKLDGDNAAAQDIWEEIRDEVNPVRRRNGLEPVTLSDLIQFQRQRGKTEQKYRDLGTNAPPAMAEIGRFAR